MYKYVTQSNSLIITYNHTDKLHKAQHHIIPHLKHAARIKHHINNAAFKGIESIYKNVIRRGFPQSNISSRYNHRRTYYPDQIIMCRKQYLSTRLTH